MIDMEKYYDKINLKKDRILEKKVNKEILLSIMFLITGISAVCIIIFTAYKQIINPAFKGINPVIYGVIMIGYVAFLILMILYSDYEPLKYMNANDKMFLWIRVLRDNINTSKARCLISLRILKIFIIRNKVLYKLSVIQNNLEDAFIFNANLKQEVKVIKDIRVAMIKILPYSVLKTDYKQHSIELLDLLIEAYSYTIGFALIAKRETDETESYEKSQLLGKLHKKSLEILDMEIEKTRKISIGNILKSLYASNISLVVVVFIGLILFSISFLNESYSIMMNKINVILTFCVIIYPIIKNWNKFNNK